MKEEVRVFTGGMNKDDEPRFLPNGDWIDALNASVSNQEGVNGNIVSEIGNEEIALYASTGNSTYTLPSGTNTTIGSVDDPVRGHTYWFVHNSNSNHTILRYEYSTNIARLVWEDNSYDQVYNPYNGDYQGGYSASTAYSKEEIVSDSGSFYRLLREDYVAQVTASAISTGADTITTNTNYFKTGDQVTTSAAIGSISAGDYYVIYVNATTIQLATTFGNAFSGTAINITGTLSGTPTITDSIGLSNESVWTDLSDTLNFNLNYPIYASTVVESSGESYLIWTDNNEQPSMLNVTNIASFGTYYPYIERRFLDLYAFQPQHPPTAAYASDTSVDQNNTAQKALQFRCAWKLRDGRTTVMSPISRIPMPTVSNYKSIQIDNKVTLKLPLYCGDSSNVIDEILIYVKENGDNNTGDWYLADTVDVSEETPSEQIYPFSDTYMWYIERDFFNTSNLSAVPTVVQDQIQDFIPSKSKCLAIGGNGRLLLGNNEDGFDFDTSTLDVAINAITRSSGLLTTDPPESGFKKTCRYPIGIVYGDRSGRLSNVYRNDDMVFDVPYWSGTNQGAVQCELQIGHAPPSWADFWIPVYAGNQTMTNWVQSAVGGVSSPSFLLKDVSDYNSNKTDAGYNYAFSSEQNARMIYDTSGSAFLTGSNGDARVFGASSYTLQADPTAFTTALANHDLVEVYTKKGNVSSSEELIWYEMGWSFKIETDRNGNKVHGGKNEFTNNFSPSRSQIIGSGAQDCVVVLDQADCYVRFADDVESTASGYKTFEYTDLFPFKESDVSTIGRPNVFNPDYKKQRREQEIVYSEPLVDNTDFFGINRFFDASFNDSLNNEYGDLNVLHSDGNELLCVQKTKTSRMLANKNFIFTADLQSLDIQSNTFLSKPQYFPQEFGTQNPESFAEYGGVKFWVDRLKGAVLRCAGSQIENIGQIKMSTYFEQNLPYPYPYNDNADGNNNKIYGGYSIRDNSYYITMDAHKIIKRIVDSSNAPTYVITMTDLDMEDGTFDRLVDFGTVPIKKIVGMNYNSPIFGMTVTASDSSAKTITVDIGTSIGSDAAYTIYVPYVDTLSFSNDRGRWISLHDFKPEWIGSSANSLCTFSGGKIYVHQLSSYTTDFFGENFNYCRFYEDVYGVYEVYNSFLEFPFNQEPNRNKEPITVWTDSNQVYSIDYAVNNDGQITETALGDYEEFEGAYWSPIFRDKTTSVVPYPLLEGDEMKGKYLKVRLKTVTDGAQQSSISSTTLKYNNSNLT